MGTDALMFCLPDLDGEKGVLLWGRGESQSNSPESRKQSREASMTHRRSGQSQLQGEWKPLGSRDDAAQVKSVRREAR